jgi:hypothetical protein
MWRTTTKRVVTIGLLGMLLACVQANCAIAQAKLQNASVTSPEEVARQFYRWYVNVGYPEPRKQPTRFLRYITQRCLKKAIAAQDYVYITGAQDADPKWKDGIVVPSALQPCIGLDRSH